MVNGVVLLIGPPGVGKSTLGRALEAQHAAGQLGQGLEAGLSLSFLNVGQVLRDEGLVDAYTQLDSTANLTALQIRARSLMDEACCKLEAASESAKAGSSRCGHQPHACAHATAQLNLWRLLIRPLRSVLVCECVKELGDAHTLLACLEDHNVSLLQVRR
jgi:hypothetical protein